MERSKQILPSLRSLESCLHGSFILLKSTSETSPSYLWSWNVLTGTLHLILIAWSQGFDVHHFFSSGSGLHKWRGHRVALAPEPAKLTWINWLTFCGHVLTFYATWGCPGRRRKTFLTRLAFGLSRASLATLQTFFFLVLKRSPNLKNSLSDADKDQACSPACGIWLTKRPKKKEMWRLSFYIQVNQANK